MKTVTIKCDVCDTQLSDPNEEFIWAENANSINLIKPARASTIFEHVCPSCTSKAGDKMYDILTQIRKP